MRYQKCSEGNQKKAQGNPEDYAKEARTSSCSYLGCTSGMTVGLTTGPIVTKEELK